MVALMTANSFGMCMGLAIAKFPDKANEITSLMVMAIAGGAVVPPVLGFAQKCAGSTGLVWVLLACLAYQAVLSISMYKNAKENGNE
jgi:fucose permease